MKNLNHKGEKMFSEIIILIFGLIFLYWGANFVVDGASNLAKKFGISKLFIGMTIVTIGTTTPELVVNLISALNGKSTIGLGNILGTNLVNILAIIGLTGLIFTVNTKKDVNKEAIFALISVTLLFIFSMIQIVGPINTISSFEGLLMLVLFIGYLYLIYKESPKPKTFSIQFFEKKSTKYLLLGFFLLIIGGNLTVNGATMIARLFNIHDFIIGATILAIGTSLPELSTSIIAALKKQQEISVGNLLGSTIYNTIFILGITSIISPISTQGYYKFFIFNILAIIILIVFLYTGKKNNISKIEGALMLFAYFIIMITMIFNF